MADWKRLIHGGLEKSFALAESLSKARAISVRISVSGAEQDRELGSLEDWLRGYPGLRDCPIRRLAAMPKPVETGAVSEVLVVALGSSGSVAALATALPAWPGYRVNDLTVKLRGPSGTVEFSARTTQDPDKLVSEIQALASGRVDTAG